MPELVCDHSASMFSSAEVVCRSSVKDSFLDFPGPASAGDEDPINRRIAGMSVPEVVVVLYVKVPSGWSNLQFGPNLQIP